MSPYFWILKGSVKEPKLHKAAAETDPKVARNFPIRPKCGTRLDRCCIEPERDLSNHHIHDLCGRCFGKAERAEMQRAQDEKDEEQRAWGIYYDQHSDVTEDYADFVGLVVFLAEQDRSAANYKALREAFLLQYRLLYTLAAI